MWLHLMSCCWIFTECLSSNCKTYGKQKEFKNSLAFKIQSLLRVGKTYTYWKNLVKLKKKIKANIRLIRYISILVFYAVIYPSLFDLTSQSISFKVSMITCFLLSSRKLKLAEKSVIISQQPFYPPISVCTYLYTKSRILVKINPSIYPLNLSPSHYSEHDSTIISSPLCHCCSNF